MSFFSLQLSVPISWSGAGADFFVYYPENMSKWKVFVMTFTGLSISFIFVNLLGVGLASGVGSTSGWDTAYNTSSGALLLAGLRWAGSVREVLCGGRRARTLLERCTKHLRRGARLSSSGKGMEGSATLLLGDGSCYYLLRVRGRWSRSSLPHLSELSRAHGILAGYLLDHSS